MKEFKLPDLGEGIEAGDVVQLLVSEGDTISAEQPIMELETDKAVVEVPCPFSGKVTKVHVSQGDKVPVGATLITVDTDGQAEGEEKAEAPAEEEAETGKADEGEKKARKPGKAGKKEARRAARAETAEAEAPDKKKVAPAKAEEKAEKKPAGEPEGTQAPGEQQAEPIPAGPSTRRLARELGVDLAAVAASNPGERLTEEQVKAFVRDKGGGAGKAAAVGGPVVTAPALPDFSQWGPIQRVPFTSLQRKTAERLGTGWRLAPHVTQFDEADVSGLEALRKRFRETDQGKEVRLTVTAFVLKAVTIALKTYPQFNASLDSESNELILKRYYHIGMAVDTDDGLIVPVLRNLDRKSVLEIATEMNEVAERTRQRKIALEDLRGGTFTVTNLGGIGGTAFTPVINHPEVAILGLGRSRQMPFVDKGELKTRMMLPLCLSYDHRVINGADGARFVRKLATLLEDAEMLLLGA